MSCGYCREQCVCAVATEGTSGCVLWVLKGRVGVCCGYGWEQCVCAVVTVGKSGCVLGVL